MSLDKVRGILFGVQTREFERRCARLEERLTRELEDIREDDRREDRRDASRPPRAGTRRSTVRDSAVRTSAKPGAGEDEAFETLTRAVLLPHA